MGKEILLSPITTKYWMLMDDYEIFNYTVPNGFITDFASIPRLLWFWLPPWGNYGRASILHDYLYCSGKVSRIEADKTMLHVMEKDDVGYLRRNIIYNFIRMFGWKAYLKSKKMRKKYGVCKKIYLKVDGDFFEN